MSCERSGFPGRAGVVPPRTPITRSATMPRPSIRPNFRRRARMLSQKKQSKPEAAVAAKPAAPSIISSDLSINGNLNSVGDIQVDGTVEGDIVSTKLTVSRSATVRGAIEADLVVIDAIGRAAVCTPVIIAHLLCRRLL